MAKEFILDIGIGSGGRYIKRNPALHEQRIGIDLDEWGLWCLRDRYPEVIPVKANAACLPFADSSFSRIEIVMPYGTLMAPGLQNDHFTLQEKSRCIYTQNYPHGWYPEFQRVLIPQGLLIVSADFSIDPLQVEKTSQGYFYVAAVDNLTIEDYATLGTHATQLALSGNRAEFFEEIGKEWKDTLVKINLRSCKTS